MDRVHLGFLGFAISAVAVCAVKARAMREVNPFLPEQDRFYFWSLWHIFKEIRLWKSHRRFCPESQMMFWYFFLMVASLGWVFAL
jgi:hypothetical protein